LDSRISRYGIRRFVRKNAMDLRDYEERSWRSFNDFFTRRVKDGARPIDYEPTHLIAPCDSKLSVYPITADAEFLVKQCTYTMESLVRDAELASRYEGGTMMIFRLTVDDYHHYCYVDDGVKTDNTAIPGVFYTVHPIAQDRYPVYRENCREYAVLHSVNFGDVLMMEVGATMVGRIVNEHGAGAVSRGQEKGRFEFGGSTVILCFEKGRVLPDGDLLTNTAAGDETVVRMGERIGLAQNAADRP
jgi:phosphatidylserine decarboxylase